MTFSPGLAADLAALVQVLVINVVLAGDNAVVVGLAVTGLPVAQRRRAILIGISLATVVRIAFALVTVQLLAIVGLTLAGGLLLLWVCWKMYRELRWPAAHVGESGAGRKTMRQAMMQIVLADVAMSLDNVLAVAGVSYDRPWVMVAGLALSVLLMGAAAEIVARLLERFRWIAWLGLLLVFYVAVKLIWEGAHEVVLAM